MVVILEAQHPQVETGDDQVGECESLNYASNLNLFQVNLANGAFADAHDEED